MGLKLDAPSPKALRASTLGVWFRLAFTHYYKGMELMMRYSSGSVCGTGINVGPSFMVLPPENNRDRKPEHRSFFKPATSLRPLGICLNRMAWASLPQLQ